MPLSELDLTTPRCSSGPGPSTAPRSSGIAPSIFPRKRNHWERRLQIYLVRQFRRLVDPLEAILVAQENGEDRSSETLALLGAMGLHAGWMDLVLVMTGARVHWIEVKLEATLQHGRTDLREDQRETHALLGFYDHRVSVVRNAGEFWTIVDSYGITHAALPPRHEQLLLPRPRRSPVRRPSTK